MKKIIMILFILSFAAPSMAATVGGPDITIPEESLFLKEEAVKTTLDRFEFDMDIRASMNIEVNFKKNLTSSQEVSNAKIEGQNYMLKFSAESFDIIEPYIMIGTSDLKVKWEQNGNTVTVEAEPGFTWGMGVKTKLMEFKDYGVKLTMDIQFRNADLNIDKPLLNGAGASARDEKCEIKEWQIALLASKKYIVPMGLRDYYIVPYTGVTFSWADVDVSFKDGNSSGPPYPLYSTYNATEDSHIGLVFGCDVMPSLLSWYLFNFELRLINETAFSLGGTMKF